jgi:septum formation protein
VIGHFNILKQVSNFPAKTVKMSGMKTSSLILASASPRRCELLAQVGIVPAKIIPADIDETPRKAEQPHAYARRISSEKAKKVAAENACAFILAADTVVAVGRRILPKAETEKEARDCLALLSGRRHRVLTALSVVAPGGRQKTAVVTSIVKFTRLTNPHIDAYINSGEWKGKAGGYAIQGLAATLISFISGSYSGIVGLPLFETGTLLKGLGYERS